MRFERDENRIYMQVSELAAYAFQRENGAKLSEHYGFIKKISKGEGADSPETIVGSFQNATTQTSLYLEKIVPCGDYSICIQGHAERISYDGVLYTVEAHKTVPYFKTGLTPFENPDLFAECVIYGYLYANMLGLSQLKIGIIYKKSNGDKIAFAALFTQVALSRMFSSLLDRAHTILEIFAERYTVFPEEAKSMPFPYGSIREGQAEFIKTAYRTIKRGENLLVSAPTGIGKTMSSLFPSVKALADGAIDKIFYLTAKTITGQAAMEAVARLARHAPHLRAVMVCAKEQLCPHGRSKTGASSLSCRYCENMNSLTKDFGASTISYRERQLAALTDLLLSDDHIYTIERIKKTALEHHVCPYELSLDLSESCMVVVCDYNYVMDDNVRFRRYFKDPLNTEKYVFLFDEAHNLPARTRNTYSSKLTAKNAAILEELADSSLADQGEFCERVREYISALHAVRQLCTESESVRQTPDGEIRYGYYEDNRVPDELVRTINNLARCIGKYIREWPDFADVLEPHYRDLSKAAFSFGFFDENFRFFASRANEDVTVQVLCLDPAGILEKMLSAARSVILFSATLSPIDYFVEVTGLIDAETLELPSPYERDNLCIVAYDSISTRLKDRKATAYDCAEVIAETVMAREGNYIVYFPSYDYMTAVCKAFASLGLDCAMIMQKSGMSYRERERFIQIFRERKHRSIVGFCVLGGMFSEGIDLAGESLIGSIIVGTGMPMLSAERNIMAAYYDEKTERGQEFAYTCPGMNKVLQAAGRVIRSEKDRGVVVLIDDRLGEANLRQHFPAHWRHMVYTGDCDSLRAVLESFWEEA